MENIPAKIVSNSVVVLGRAGHAAGQEDDLEMQASLEQVLKNPAKFHALIKKMVEKAGLKVKPKPDD